MPLLAERRPLSPAPKTFTTDIQTINVPTNGISPEGQKEISLYLKNQGLAQLPEDWCWDWKVAKGTFAGTFPKRVARFLYKERQQKVSEEILSQLGNIASAHIFSSDVFYIDFTNDFSWLPGDFREDSGSCFWGCRRWAKDMIYENGGFAIRFYRSPHKYYIDCDEERLNGLGRAWIVPLLREDNSPEVIFNSYGIDLLLVARLYALLKGKIYERVRLINNECSDKMLWINGTTGFIVGSMEQIAKFPQGSFVDLKLREWCRCSMCESVEPEEQFVNLTTGGTFGYGTCGKCMDKNYDVCPRCLNLTHISNFHLVDNQYKERVGFDRICTDGSPSCLTELFVMCTTCTHSILKEDSSSVSNYTLCRECFDKYVFLCDICGEGEFKQHLHSVVHPVSGNIVSSCRKCFNEIEKIKQKVITKIKKKLEDQIPSDKYFFQWDNNMCIDNIVSIHNS